MSAEIKKEIELEIGHVLFIDMVGYSKLLINEQSEHMQTLREIVRGTEQFRVAEAAGKLLRLPTGDGGALVFRTSLEAPVLCALEISKELKSHPELRVRMGIHGGPVNEITDLNEQGEHCWCRHQYCPAGDGLRRRWSHPAIATCRRRFGTVSALATVSARVRRMGSEARRARRCRESLWR
jgi:hypothetical protein